MAVIVNDLLLPRANAALVNKDGTATIEFRNFLLQFVRDAGAAGAVTEEQLLALTARVQALEDAALEEMLRGYYSVSVNGNIIYLVGDVANPQGSQYYGTNRDGARGWYNLIDGFETGTGLTKTISTEGFNFLGYIDSTSELPPTGSLNDAYILNGRYIYWNGTEWADGGTPSNIATLALVPLADSGTGALLAITRDAYGRVSGTKPATIIGTLDQIDVANGDASAGLPTLSLAAPVLDSLGRADSAVQSVVAGSNITVDNTDPQNPVVSSISGGGIVETIVAGDGITVDSSDPANPIISSDIALSLPFTLQSGASYIPLTVADELPFFLADGSPSNIPMAP